MNKDKWYALGPIVVIILCVAAFATLTQLDNDNDPHTWVTPIRAPGYAYELHNYSATVTLTLVINGTEIPISVVMEVDEYFVAVEQIGDDLYELRIIIKGLYVNASIGTSEGIIIGGTAICDEFYFISTITENTPEAIEEALMGVLTVEQWTMEA